MKSIFSSKTFWTNVISLACMIATASGSPYAQVLGDEQTQAAVIGGITTVANIALRAVTKEPVKII